MNKPKLTPSSPAFEGRRDVFAGSQSDPGASLLDTPSMKTTATMNKVDAIPSIDVSDSSDSGINTVGTNLQCGLSIHIHGVRVEMITNTSTPQSLYVLAEC
jgi:hypothetical protein